MQTMMIFWLTPLMQTLLGVKAHTVRSALSVAAGQAALDPVAQNSYEKRPNGSLIYFKRNFAVIYLYRGMCAVH